LHQKKLILSGTRRLLQSNKSTQLSGKLSLIQVIQGRALDSEMYKIAFYDFVFQIAVANHPEKQVQSFNLRHEFT